MLKLLLLNIAALWFPKCFMAIDAWETLLSLSPGKIVYKEDTPKVSVLPEPWENIRLKPHSSPSRAGGPRSLTAQKSLNWSWTFGTLQHILHPSRTQTGSLATLLPSCPPTQNCSPFFLPRLLGSLSDGVILKVSEKLPLPSLNCPPRREFSLFITRDVYIELSQFRTCFHLSFFIRCSLLPYEVGVIFSILRWGNWSLEELSNLPKFTQLANEGTMAGQSKKMSPHYYRLCSTWILIDQTLLLWFLDFSRSFSNQPHWNFASPAILTGMVPDPALWSWVGFPHPAHILRDI